MTQQKFGRLLGFVRFLAPLGIIVLLSSPARAGHEDQRRPHKSHSAPEIDPAGIGAIASLLVGGTMLLKSRRGSRPGA